MINLPQRDQYLYQPNYCEENIWQLCRHPEFQQSDVVVMASRGEVFPLLQQRISASPTTPVFWDYHVVLAWQAEGEGRYILDFDTTLPFCTPVGRYFDQSLLNESQLKPAYVPLFRLVSAADYVEKLLTDRSHMKVDDGWQSPPPEWPPICAGDSNLRKFTDMGAREFGEVLTQKQLVKRLICNDTSE